MSEAAVTLAAPVAEQRCRIAEVFEPGFIELLQLAPGNPLVHGLILKLTGQMPPTGCTFEQLKDWVELNCQKRNLTQVRPGQSGRTSGIRINVDFSEVEYGRAQYSVSRSGSDDFRVSAEELMAMIHEALGSGGGLGEVVDTIAGKIEDDAWSQCDPSMEAGDDYEYTEHDHTETNDSETSYSRDEIRSAVLAFLQQRHPELAAELQPP